MNKRIKELMIEAGGEFWQRLENDVVKKDAYITFDPPESLEKFAELIINQCIRAANTTPDMRKSGAAERIKEVFGIE